MLGLFKKEENKLAKHLAITGTVQGVGYRASFMYQARSLALSGWVRNRLDGSVEAMVSGDAQAVRAIIEWAQRGPPSAIVKNVEIDDVDDVSLTDGEFEMRATQ